MRAARRGQKSYTDCLPLSLVFCNIAATSQPQVTCTAFRNAGRIPENPSPGIQRTLKPAGTQVKKKTFRTFVAFLGFALLFATQLSAQQLATLNVTVTDPSGSVISLAKVSLRNLETDGKRTDFSSVTGVAVVPGLPAGKYQLTVESSQFSTYQGSLTLTVGQNASIPVTLGIKTVQEDVEVQETAQGVDSQKSEVSQVIDTEKIADLPISGRDFIDFVLLTSL